MDQHGTLERLLGELTKLLAPLTSLTPSAAPVLLAELGLPVTEAQASQLGPVLSGTTTGVGTFVNMVIQLEDAIAAQNWKQVVEQGIAAVNQAGRVLADFAQLQTALGGLSLPGVGTIIGNLPGQLFNYLLSRYLGRSPGVSEVLELTGILERTDHNVGVFDPDKPFYTTSEFHFDRIGGWLGNPSSQLTGLYDWGNSTFDGKKVLATLDQVIAGTGLPTLYDPSAAQPELDLFFLTVAPRTDLNPRGLEVRLNGGLGKGSVAWSSQLWTLTLSLDANVLSGTSLLLQPGIITVHPPEAAKLTGKIEASYLYSPPSSDPLVLLAIAGGSQISVEEVSASITLETTADGKTNFGLGSDWKRGKILITTGDADGFLAKILSGFRVESAFDFSAGFSLQEGLHFQGSSTLEIHIPAHVSIGPVEIETVTLSVGIGGQTFPTTVTADLKTSLGPLVAVVEGLGFKLDIALGSYNSGNLGPLALRPQFKPPKGVGLSLDAGAVKGGGYLFYDSDRAEYAGALELDLAGIVTAKAIGLLTTRLPDGSDGYSLLIIISAEFGSGIQLGFGFTLLAVGGLVGLNRTMRLDALTDGVRSGAINSVMFPQDVVANAPRIISDLRTFFPPQDGKFLIGPMLKIGWGTPTLISLSVGIVIEIPGNIAILGVLRLALPTDDVAVLVLQVNFLGAIEFDKKLVWFFASLFDSHILFITLSGELGVLVAFGDDANLVVAVGGFHPRFNPPPLPFPAPRRLCVSLIDTSYARIRVEGYFAVTTNSVQFGANAEAVFGFDDFGIEGHLGFDALIVFSPFHFTISASASFSLKLFGVGVYSIGVSFTLEGPTPWRVQGTGYFSILFIHIHADFDFTWGDRVDTMLPPVAVLPILQDAFSQAQNWRAELPGSAVPGVTLRPLGADEAAHVLHPAGTVRVRQTAVPLDLNITKVGNRQASDVNRVSVRPTADSHLVSPPGGQLQDPFAPEQYQDLDDAGRLSRPAYEMENSGLVLTAGANLYATPALVKRSMRYNRIIIDNTQRIPPKLKYLPSLLFGHWIQGTSTARSVLSQASRLKVQPFSDGIRIKPEGYAVVHVNNNKLVAADAVRGSQGQALDYLNARVKQNPTLAGQFQVVPTFEVSP